jgi:hypothetical protein
MEKSQPKSQTNVLFSDDKGKVRVGKFVCDTAYVDRPASIYIQTGFELFKEGNVKEWANIPENLDDYKETGNPRDNEGVLYVSGGSLSNGDYDAKGKTNFQYQNYYGPMASGTPWTAVEKWFKPEKLFSELRSQGLTHQMSFESPVQRPLPKEQYMSAEDLRREKIKGSEIGYNTQNYIVIVSLPANQTKLEPLTSVYATTAIPASVIKNAFEAFHQETELKGFVAGKMIVKALEIAQTDAMYHDATQSVFMARVPGSALFNNKEDPNRLLFDGKKGIRLVKIFDVEPTGEAKIIRERVSQDLEM